MSGFLRVLLTLALVAVLAVAPCNCSDVESAEAPAKDVKFVKIEKMLHRHFTPKGNVAPAEQIALFREENRRQVASKLTKLMEVSRNRERVMQMAKDRIEARMREINESQ
jgi:hypothetical protein